MSAAAVRASRTPPFIAPTPTKPRITSGALSAKAAEGRQRAADRSDDEGARDDRDATQSVHQPSRRESRQGAGRQEDRRPEPEDRLDARDEDERDRRHGNGQLEDARQRQQAQAEQDRVALDLLRAGHPREPSRPPSRRPTNGLLPAVWTHIPVRVVPARNPLTPLPGSNRSTVVPRPGVRDSGERLLRDVLTREKATAALRPSPQTGFPQLDPAEGAVVRRSHTTPCLWERRRQ